MLDLWFLFKSLQCLLKGLEFCRSNSQVSTKVNGIEGIDIVSFEESFAGRVRLLHLCSSIIFALSKTK